MNRKEIIIKLLEKYPQTRNNDNELIYRYLKWIKAPTDYEKLRTLNYNVADSISRIRRKIQESRPDLGAERHNKKMRTQMERIIKEEMRKTI